MSKKENQVMNVQYPQINGDMINPVIPIPYSVEAPMQMPVIPQNEQPVLQYPSVPVQDSTKSNIKMDPIQPPNSQMGNVIVKETKEPTLTKRNSKTPLLNESDIVVIDRRERNRKCCKKCCLIGCITILIITTMLCCALIVCAVVNAIVFGALLATCFSYKNMESFQTELALGPYGTDLKIIDVSNFGSFEILEGSNVNEKILISYKFLGKKENSRPNYELGFENSTGTLSLHTADGFLTDTLGHICSDLDIQIFLRHDRSDLIIKDSTKMLEPNKVFNIEGVILKELLIDRLGYGKGSIKNVTLINGGVVNFKYTDLEMTEIKTNSFEVGCAYSSYTITDLMASSDVSISGGYSHGILERIEGKNIDFITHYSSIDIKEIKVLENLSENQKYGSSNYESLNVNYNITVNVRYGSVDITAGTTGNIMMITSKYSSIDLSDLGMNDMYLNHGYDTINYDKLNIQNEMKLFAEYSNIDIVDSVIQNILIEDLKYSGLHLNGISKVDVSTSTGLSYNMRYSSIVMDNCDLGSVNMLNEMDYSHLYMDYYPSNMHDLKVNFNIHIDYGTISIQDMVSKVSLSTDLGYWKVGAINGPIDNGNTCNAIAKYSYVSLVLHN